MSASRNADAVSGQEGQIGSHIPRDEPMTTHGHKPGVLVGNDTVPTFHAETIPAGSAPPDSIFTPNSTTETPGQANNDNVLRSHGKESTQTSASDTLGGASSGDVHTGMGHPGQGQTSQELRDEGGRGGGLAGVGASAQSGNQMVDGRDPDMASQRGEGKEEGAFAGTRGDKGGEYGAGGMENESA